MAMMENSVTKSLYKIELYLIKIIPTIIAGCYLLNNVLSYFNIETPILSAIGGLSILPWTFLFISSFVFKFCIYHRLPLYYILVSDIINYIDLYIGIPIDINDFFVLHLTIAGFFILLIVFYKFKQHESRTSK